MYRGGWTPPISKPIVVGEEGFFLLRYSGADLAGPVYGEYTGERYDYHKRRLLYVDRRDGVYLMGPEFELCQ